MVHGGLGEACAAVLLQARVARSASSVFRTRKLFPAHRRTSSGTMGLVWKD